MEGNANTVFVKEIMMDYAGLTGLEPVDAHPRRYLWTDAFAVCNFLELFRRTNDKTFLNLALRLVDQVHHILGRHRDDDPRTGWISGLSDEEGERHPTVGGLRIGKQLNERKPNEVPDPRLEWEQDGQYYHYLTKWMHALVCVTRVTGDTTYAEWAVELAKKAHAAFTYAPAPGGRRRMYWKMSIDLTYPLVSSMGQHDPLDGFVTYSELQAVAREFEQGSKLDLGDEITDMANICRGGNWITDDPLGVGGLLFDASRIAQLMKVGGNNYAGLLEKVVDSAMFGMGAIAESGFMDYPSEYRLAFRELGLSIGLRGVEKLQETVKGNPGLFVEKGHLNRQIESLMGYLPLGETIEKFWRDGINREASTYAEHREINMAMLATSLAPEEFLTI